MRWAALLTLAATWLLSSANGHAADRLSAPALKPAPVPMPSSPTTVVMTNGMAAPDYAACLSDLARTGAVYQPLGDLTKEGCALSGAVQLQSVATNFGAVTISGEPIMLCSFARQFVSWVRDIGAPLTLAYTGARLTTIETGPGFVCRNRYNQPDAKISEHAKGNAIDIAAFALSDKQRISVKPQPNDPANAQELLRIFRTSGCGYFTTILGPGSNAAHEEHLHFDYGMHGKTMNYRICE